MRLVIQHEDTQEVIAFEYESKDKFNNDLFEALEEYLDMTFSDRNCVRTLYVGGIKFNVDFFLSYNGLGHPQYDIPEVYTLKEWFSEHALKAE